MSEQITVTLPDGSRREHPRGTTPAAVAAEISARLAKAAVAAKADGSWIDLGTPLTHDTDLQLVVADTDGGREVLRHSTAHVMAEAVTRLFPGAKYAIGPAIDDGFYYDFELPGGATFSDDDLGRIEAEMRKIVKADEQFDREELSYDDALALFADQPYKREIIEKVRDGDASAEDSGEVGGDGAGVSVYRNLAGDNVAFTDLCRGPHVPSTGKLGAFKLHEGRGRVLARQREGSDAPAHLRHRVGVEDARSTTTCTDSKKRRSATTASSAPSSTCSRSPRRSARGSRCSTRRARWCGASWRSTRGNGTRRAATRS